LRRCVVSAVHPAHHILVRWLAAHYAPRKTRRGARLP
jgi:hypothetical protein